MSAKGKKLSKAEKDRLKKEEEEEAARLEAEKLFKEKQASKLKALKRDILVQERSNREILTKNTENYKSFTDNFLNRLCFTTETGPPERLKFQYVHKNFAKNISYKFYNTQINFFLNL